MTASVIAWVAGSTLDDDHLGQAELLQPVGAEQSVVEVVVVEHVPLLGVRERHLVGPQLEHARRQQLDDDAVVLARRARARGCGSRARRRP